MSCFQAGNSELIERYLRDELVESDLETFETHVLECDDCAGELTRLAALRMELDQRREAIEARRDSEVPNQRWVWMALAATVIVGLALMFLLRRGPGSDVVALAEIEPPVYQHSQLRGPVDEADQRFRAGMDRYLAADYRSAVHVLEAAAALDPNRVDIPFFMGASQLLSGAAEESTETLARVIAEADSPFLEEALFLRAQAYLSLGEGDMAALDLRSILELEGDWTARAQGQIEQLEALSKEKSGSKMPL